VTPGEHFDRYVIRAKFGAGGMAARAILAGKQH